MSRRRPDDTLRSVDLQAAISAGMSVAPGVGLSQDPARATMFTGAAIAASYRAESLGVGPYPLGFLAGCIRAMGLRAAHALPEPLIGEQPTDLVRGWMLAAGVGGPVDPARDEIFARWLERVAMLIAVRRQVASAAVVESAAEQVSAAGESAILRTVE